MNEAAYLGTLLQRLSDGTASETDRQALRDHIAAGHLSLASGARAVAVGGNATDALIVTGDGNIVFKGGNADALRQAFLALYPARLRQLPADLPDFTGRKPEVDKLLRLFLGGSGQAAISALGGMGGVGKTALAVHVAHKLAEHYPEAQIVVDLAGTSEAPLSPEVAMARVIAAFEPQARLPESREDIVSLYRSVLAGRQALLLLDNAASGAQVKDLLPQPPVAAIVTSRRTITLPGLTALNLDVLSTDEARDLLRTILRERTVSDQEITAIARWCGRLPLALRTAGSFLANHPDWGVGEYLNALAHEKERLRRLRHEDLEVEAVLGLSAALLARENPEWAGRWQMLTVYPGSFDRAGAATVWQVDEAEARDTLGELLAQSLVLYDADEGRYRLHDLMRLVARNAFGYGGGTSDAEADLKRLEDAAAWHAFHYYKILDNARVLYLKGGESLANGLRLFDREWDNIRTGQAWAADHAEADENAAELCCAYGHKGSFFLLLRTTTKESMFWFKAALNAAEHLKTSRITENAHVSLLLSMGNALYFSGQTDEPIEYYEKGLAIVTESGDLPNQGAFIGNLGNCYSDLGDEKKAIEYFQRHIAIARECKDRKGEGSALGNVGVTYLKLGEYKKAKENVVEAISIFREAGDRKGEGEALRNLGRAKEALGESQQAIELYEQALAIAREIGHKQLEKNVLGELGNAYFLLKEYRQAMECYEQILAMAREIGDRKAEGTALGSLGNVYNMIGEYRIALQFYGQDLLIAREIGDRQGVGTVLANISLVLASLEEWDQAIKLAEKALEILNVESPAAEVVRQNLVKWRQKI
jgi:tetratricopeptide (TPR) repeat protein